MVLRAEFIPTHGSVKRMANANCFQCFDLFIKQAKPVQSGVHYAHLSRIIAIIMVAASKQAYLAFLKDILNASELNLCTIGLINPIV